MLSISNESHALLLHGAYAFVAVIIEGADLLPAPFREWFPRLQAVAGAEATLWNVELDTS
jgi:hypothetical protein